MKPIHCITAQGKPELNRLVKVKRGEGYRTKGKPLPIGGGYMVQMMQMMVEKCK